MTFQMLIVEAGELGKPWLCDLMRHVYPKAYIKQVSDAEQALKAVRLHQYDYVCVEQGFGGALLQRLLARAQSLVGVLLGEDPNAQWRTPCTSSEVVDLLAHLRRQMPSAPEPQAVQVQLTRREEQILVLMARGLSRREMAQVLQLSSHTVASYIKTLYRKAGIHSRAEAAVFACQAGVIRLA